MGKKRKQKIHKSSPQKKGYQKIKPEIKSTKGTGLKKFLALTGFIATIIGIVANWEKINPLFQSNKEKYDKEHFVEGKLKPEILNLNDSLNTEKNIFFFTEGVSDTLPKIKGIHVPDFYKNHEIIFKLGTNEFGIPTSIFRQGIDIFNYYGITNDKGIRLLAGVKDDRLYVSFEFKDLQKEEAIGYIEFNNWRLFKPNLFDFKNDDKRLEVKDRQNNIVISIKYYPKDSNPVVEINGYFIGVNSVLTIANKSGLGHIPKNNVDWKKLAMEHIREIKSVF